MWPFSLLEIELRGRSELKSISRIEPAGEFNFLQGQMLFCGMYLNELLVRLLPLDDPQPQLFEHYTLSVQGLSHGLPMQPLLRSFEWRLLEQLGYGFSFTEDVHGQALQGQMSNPYIRTCLSVHITLSAFANRLSCKCLGQ